MIELIGAVQNYAWGKIGSSSLVARLSGVEIKEDKPYAELWIGAHPNGTSVVKGSNEPLNAFLWRHLDTLGKSKIFFQENGTLTFLLKILSIQKPLSIQCHPYKEKAEFLHNCYPHLYKDPNHKPEMAIALTPFRALCGFRPPEEIRDFCVNVIELQRVITPQLIRAYKRTMNKMLLEKMLLSLMTKSDEKIDDALQQFFRRCEDADDYVKQQCNYSLVKELYDQFPGDSGVFWAFFLNEVTAEPGEVIYIPPGIPHAYISGDCVECMACSDNVVRAGLTPKFKDIEVLLEILEYESFSAENVKFKPSVLSPYATNYHPRIQDFGLTRAIIPKSVTWVSPFYDSCQIFIVLEGEGTCTGPLIEYDAEDGSTEDANSSTKPRRTSETVGYKPLKSLSQIGTIKLQVGTIVYLSALQEYIFNATTEHLDIYIVYRNSSYEMPVIGAIRLPFKR